MFKQVVLSSSFPYSSSSSFVKRRNSLHHLVYDWRKLFKINYSKTIVLASDDRKERDFSDDDQAISSMLNKLHSRSSFNTKRREDLIKQQHSNHHHHKPKTSNSYLDSLEQEEFGQHIKTTTTNNDDIKENKNNSNNHNNSTISAMAGSKATKNLMSTLQTLKSSKNSSSTNSQQQTGPNDDFITSQPKQLKANHVFKKHFRQEKTNYVEMNDLDEKWTRYVVDKDGSIPGTIRKHLSPIEVDGDKLTEEEQIQVYSKGYSEWINPDHKQKNVINPVGDISHLKTIKKLLEQNKNPTIEEKLGLVDSISSNTTANPLDDIPSIQWQRQLPQEDLAFSTISFTGEVSNDPYEYNAFLMEDVEDLELDIEKIEQEAALFEEARDKEAERLLVGDDNEEDFIMSKDGTMSTSDGLGISNMLNGQFQDLWSSDKGQNQQQQQDGGGGPMNPSMAAALEKSYREFLAKSQQQQSTTTNKKNNTKQSQQESTRFKGGADDGTKHSTANAHSRKTTDLKKRS